MPRTRETARDTPPPEPPADRAAEVLTPREREILKLIAEAKTERAIARQLGLSPKTVHAHRTNIMRKLRVHNAIALLRLAIRLGLIEP